MYHFRRRNNQRSRSRFRSRFRRQNEKSPELQLIKKTRGVSAYLKAVAEVPFHCPEYWSGVSSRSDSHEHFLQKLCIKLGSKFNVYKVVANLLYNTWKLKLVGQGADAINLGNLNYSKIYVRAVWRVDNAEHYRKYHAKVSSMCIEEALSDSRRNARTEGNLNEKARSFLGYYMLYETNGLD